MGLNCDNKGLNEIYKLRALNNLVLNFDWGYETLSSRA